MIGPAPPQIGGMESFMSYLLSSGLSRRFPIVHLNIAKPLINLRPKYRAPAGYAASFRRNIFISLISYGYSVFFFFAFIRLLIRHPVAIVHVHTASYTSFWEKCFYIGFSRALRKAVVLHIHGSRFAEFCRDSRPLARKLIAATLGRCDRVLVLSQSWRGCLSGLVDPERIVVIPNGIDLRAYTPAEEEKDDAPFVLFLGAVTQRKGIYDLVRATAKTVQQFPALRCIIAGAGEIDRAAALARELGIPENVELAGPQIGSEKIGLLQRAWFLVLPSHAEGLPIAVIEAYACGLPVISTRVGGIPELLEDGVNGFLIDPGDIEALSGRLSKLIRDSDLRRAMGEKNVEVARSDYDMEICAARIGNVYQELMTD